MLDGIMWTILFFSTVSDRWSMCDNLKYTSHISTCELSQMIHLQVRQASQSYFDQLFFFSCVRECHLCYKLNISPLFRIFQEKSSYYETWHINLSPYPPKRLMIHPKRMFDNGLKACLGSSGNYHSFPKLWQRLQISQNWPTPKLPSIQNPSDCQMCLRTSQEWI